MCSCQCVLVGKPHTRHRKSGTQHGSVTGRNRCHRIADFDDLDDSFVPKRIGPGEGESASEHPDVEIAGRHCHGSDQRRARWWGSRVLHKLRDIAQKTGAIIRESAGLPPIGEVKPGEP
jgi:hypothetical protein